jgi:Domain of unknown function (DUF4287)
VAWLKKDFGLGHGHSIAIVALLKGIKVEIGYPVGNGRC